MKKTLGILTLMFVAVWLSGCDDPKTAQRTLDSFGFMNVKITGTVGILSMAFTGCGDDDRFATGFTATNPAGKQVSGVVCNGWFKAGTVRMD